MLKWIQDTDLFSFVVDMLFVICPQGLHAPLHKSSAVGLIQVESQDVGAQIHTPRRLYIGTRSRPEVNCRPMSFPTVNATL